MKCENHPSVAAIGLCSNCSTPLCGICSRYVGDDIYCEKCEQISSLSSFVENKSRGQDRGAMGSLLEEGERQEQQRPHVEQHSNANKVDRSEKVQMAIVIACCVFIVFQITRSLGSGAILSEQQIAAQEQTRDQIEACMLIFWEIAMQFSNGEQANTSRSCPGSTAPLIVARSDGDVIVRHPQPESLGVSDIYVSRSNPTPILVE